MNSRKLLHTTPIPPVELTFVTKSGDSYTLANGETVKTPPLGALWLDSQNKLWIQIEFGPYCLDQFPRTILDRDKLPKITLTHGIVIAPAIYHAKVRNGVLTVCRCEHNRAWRQKKP